MKMRQRRLQRARSKDGSRHVTDEIFNTCSSGAGALLAAIGAGALIWQAWQAGKPWHVVGFSVYGLFLVHLFVSSALHHGIDGSEQTEHRLRQWDYFSIFLMIAGTMTPFCVILLRSPLGWASLTLIWMVAIVGIYLKARQPDLPKWLTTTLYVSMGWFAVIIFYPVYLALGTGALFWLGLGGIFYTGGSALYLCEWPNLIPQRFGFHEIWHLCVLAGAASHFYVMYTFLLPHG